jgi:hypothetical protein
VWQIINQAMLMDVRAAGGQRASPIDDVIDSQTVRRRKPGRLRGYVAEKMIKDRKRHDGLPSARRLR